MISKNVFEFKFKNIHSEKKRFGKEAFIFMEMMDGYKKVREEGGGFQTDIFYNKHYKKMNDKNINSKKVLNFLKCFLLN